jgi:hypothetical protein
MIQTVYTSKFSIFSTVSKCEPKTTERSFQNNQNIASNGLIGAENRMAKIEERLLAVESTTINCKIQLLLIKFKRCNIYFSKRNLSVQ